MFLNPSDILIAETWLIQNVITWNVLEIHPQPRRSRNGGLLKNVSFGWFNVPALVPALVEDKAGPIAKSRFDFFARASERRVLPIVGVCISSSHLHIFISSSHLLICTFSHHLHIFTSSHLHIFPSSHLLIFTSSHLHIFTSSPLHICSSSHLHICSSSHLLILTSSHLHILTSSHLLLLPSCPLGAKFFISPLASWSGATNHWKKHSESRLSYLFAHLHLLSSYSFSSTLLSSDLSLLSASALLCSSYF